MQTEEALKKKMEIELLVERSQDPSEGVAKLALQTLSTELRGGTSSMISGLRRAFFLFKMELRNGFSMCPYVLQCLYR